MLLWWSDFFALLFWHAKVLLLLFAFDYLIFFKKRNETKIKRKIFHNFCLVVFGRHTFLVFQIVYVVLLFKERCIEIMKFDVITTFLIYAGHSKTSSTKG